MSEAYVPAQHPETGQEARVPPSDVDSSGAGRDQGPSPEGPRPPVGVIWRIDRRDTFLALRSARRVRSGPLAASWVPGDPAEPPRVALAVGRRIGNAVVRNRVRRQLRAIARGRDLEPGAWLFAAAPGVATLTFDELAGVLGAVATKAVRRAARGSLPATTDPATTDPAPTEPAPTDPATTDPAAAGLFAPAGP